MKSELTREIALEDLPEAYQDVAEEIGFEATLKLAELFGGQYIYYPKLDTILRQKRDQGICREFNGSNYTELCKKYRLSSQQIRNILNRQKDEDNL